MHAGQARMLGILAGAAALAAAATGIAVGLLPGSASASSPTQSQLQSELNHSRSGAGALQSGISRDTAAIERIEGRVSVLAARQYTLQSTVDRENRQLSGLGVRLSAARLALSAAREAFAGDRHALAAELVAQYESPPPTFTEVLFESSGFAQLLENVSQLRDMLHEDVQTAQEVSAQRTAVARETSTLESLQAQHLRVYAAALVQRDEISQVRLATVQNELRYAHARGRKDAQLASLQEHEQSLQGQLTSLQKQAAAAEAAPGAAYLPSGTGYNGQPFVPHGGDYGLFLAPGTNYTVGEEPEIAARLNALGEALHLHLIGLSGYRTPEHSVAVGGFWDDPHTRGQASDTPGIEGVPESVLEQFGLERPFPGAREADHIQLVGSPL